MDDGSSNGGHKTGDDTNTEEKQFRRDHPRPERRESQNPSPPPEVLEASETLAGDAIGETLFSERWVLRTLMKLTEVVSQKTKEESNADEDDDSDAIQQLDREIESLLCQLWDMCTDKDVVKFLVGLPTLDMIADAMTYTKMPRLTEIVVGILGNMCCVDEALTKVTDHLRLRMAALQLLDMSDPPTLTEVFRFLLTCVRSKTHFSTWLKYFREDENFLPHLTFIMASSTNVRLLTMAADFVDSVLDVSDDLCGDWSTSEFVDSLLEAVRQIGFRITNVAETYLHILQLLSTSANGKAALTLHQEAVVGVVSSYLRSICDDECILVRGHEAGLASALLLVHILLLTSVDSMVKHLDKESTLASVVKLTQTIRKEPNNQRMTGHPSHDDDQHEPQMLRDIFQDAVVTLLEELLDDRKGTELLLRTLEKSGEERCRDVLAWVKAFPGDQRCHGQLRAAISADGRGILKKLDTSVGMLVEGPIQGYQ